MTPEEILLIELIKFQSQVYEDQEKIKALCIKTIEDYGAEKYDAGYAAGCLDGQGYSESE
jgi:hypothetical protein